MQLSMQLECNKGSEHLMEWQITESEIQKVERLLLPHGCHFADDALQVIRCWDSVDVSACPGSGKTTVLLAKLKLIADRMPIKNGAGICVLSHTNVAINEIKKKLAGYADMLIGYPNYIGTIQSFIDCYITIPYIREIIGRSVQAVDDRTYAQHMLQKMENRTYSALAYTVKSNYQNSGNRYTDRIEHIMALRLRDDGALCVANQKKALAGADKQSTHQFIKLVDDLLKDEGIIRYQDVFHYADKAIEELSEQYTSLFCQRFQYVYIDEYQDCNETQRIALRKLFDPSKCVVTHIGDPDQAIYNSNTDQTADWCPSNGFLSIASSCRYSQKIADILSPLRKDKTTIRSSLGGDGLNPVLIIYEKGTIDKVLGTFVSLLEERGLHDLDGTYKVIGHVRKMDAAGINISSYWDGFDGAKVQQSEYKYWGIIEEICSQLQQGKLYRAESLMRKLICRIFHYVGVKNAKNGREHTPLSIRVPLKENYNDLYPEHILRLAQLADYTRESVDSVVRTIIDALLNINPHDQKSIFNYIPSHFMEEPIIDHCVKTDKNIFVEPLRGRRIQFDTIHGVKGETHDATLYLETELQNGSDIGRALCYYGVGQAGTSSLFDYSRKIVYVGMSRPRKLLCIAIQDSTYRKSGNVFQNWDKVDLRKN